jgi:hypothetical protein
MKQAGRKINRLRFSGNFACRFRMNIIAAGDSRTQLQTEILRTMKTHLLPLLTAALLSITAMGSAAVPKAADPCLAKIPTSLGKQLALKFPNDRLPTVRDSRKDHIAEDRKQGGDGCLLVAVGDFNGDKQQDVAMVLFSKKGRQLRLVACMKDGEAWEIESLSTWDGRDDNPYIQPLVPGKYRRTKAVEGPVTQPGELAFFSSKMTGFVHGTIESSGCAYFLSKGKWVHVWVSD